MKSVTTINGRCFGMEAFTLQDCRNISLLMESECFPMIQEYLMNKCFGCQTSIEYFYALLKGASDFIDYNMALIDEEGNPIKVYIDFVLKKLQPYLDDKNKKTFVMGTLQVETRLPKKLYHENTYDQLFNSISYMKTMSKDLDFSKCNPEHAMDIIDSIPPELVTDIEEHVNSTTHNIEIFSHKKLGVVEIQPYSNDMLV